MLWFALVLVEVHVINCKYIISTGHVLLPDNKLIVLDATSKAQWIAQSALEGYCMRSIIELCARPRASI